MINYRLIITVYLFTFLMLGIMGCEYDYYEPILISEDDTISFTENIIPIFEGNCLGSGCHVTNGGVAPNLEQSYAYLSLTGGNYVDTTDPESSLLYTKLFDDMPPVGKLSDSDISRILIWIKQGASNN